MLDEGSSGFQNNPKQYPENTSCERKNSPNAGEHTPLYNHEEHLPKEKKYKELFLRK